MQYCNPISSWLAHCHQEIMAHRKALQRIAAQRAETPQGLANCLPANALRRRGRAEASGLGTDTPAGNGRAGMTGRVNAGRQGLRVERASRWQRLRIKRARVVLGHRLCPGERSHRRGCQHRGTGNGRRRRTKDSWHDESSSSPDRGHAIGNSSRPPPVHRAGIAATLRSSSDRRAARAVALGQANGLRFTRQFAAPIAGCPP
jgi:hypothetical protein